LFGAFCRGLLREYKLIVVSETVTNGLELGLPGPFPTTAVLDE